MAKSVAGYELSLPRIEGYGAVMAGLADWAGKDPKAVKAMMARAPENAAAIDAVMKKAQADSARAPAAAVRKTATPCRWRFG